MLAIFTDNTMTTGTMIDRQGMPVVATSVFRGLERLAAYLLRAIVAPVAAGLAPSERLVPVAVRGCQCLHKDKQWRPGPSGNSNLPQGSGLPVGSGTLRAG